MTQQRKCMSAKKKRQRRKSKWKQSMGHTNDDAMVYEQKLSPPTVVETTGNCVEAVIHTTGVSLITCCPPGLVYTHSPFHFLCSNGTLEQQYQKITQNSLYWPPGWLKLTESANLHRLRDNKNHRGLILNLVCLIVKITPLFPNRWIIQMYWKT